MSDFHDAVIAAYGRSSICKAGRGAFSQIHPLEYTAQTLKGVLEKLPGLDVNTIDDLIVGTAGPYNELGWNIARLIVHRAELPDSIPGQTINRFCASSLQAAATCANAIMCGQADVLIAGGVEHMSSKGSPPDMEMANKWIETNYPGAFTPMGITAENVAARFGISREEMDMMAVESHKKAYAAQASGLLGRSIIPVTTLDINGNLITIDKDEGIRPDTSIEACAKLKPAFIPDGVVTAATSSQASDGASFLVLMSGEKAKGLGIRPLARLTAFAVAGCEAEIMGVGPVYAVPKVLKLAGLSMEDMDVIELNEAFASQAIYCIKELNMPSEKVNPWGGAMALGHPMGATGGILIGKALDYLEETSGKYALVTMCIGGGMGAAGIFEKL